MMTFSLICLSITLSMIIGTKNENTNMTTPMAIQEIEVIFYALLSIGFSDPIKGSIICNDI